MRFKLKKKPPPLMIHKADKSMGINPRDKRGDAKPRAVCAVCNKRRIIFQDEEEWQVLLRGTLYSALVEDEREKRLRAAAGEVTESGDFVLKSPMPGLVIKVAVEEGDEIKKGDVLVILESMKMQNELKAPRDGKVTRVMIKDGDSIEQKETMLVLE